MATGSIKPPSRVLMSRPIRAGRNLLEPKKHCKSFATIIMFLVLKNMTLKPQHQINEFDLENENNIVDRLD